MERPIRQIAKNEGSSAISEAWFFSKLDEGFLRIYTISHKFKAAILYYQK